MTTGDGEVPVSMPEHAAAEENNRPSATALSYDSDDLLTTRRGGRPPIADHATNGHVDAPADTTAEYDRAGEPGELLGVAPPDATSGPGVDVEPLQAHEAVEPEHAADAVLPTSPGAPLEYVSDAGNELLPEDLRQVERAIADVPAPEPRAPAASAMAAPGVALDEQLTAEDAPTTPMVAGEPAPPPTDSGSDAATGEAAASLPAPAPEFEHPEAGEHLPSVVAPAEPPSVVGDGTAEPLGDGTSEEREGQQDGEAVTAEGSRFPVGEGSTAVLPQERQELPTAQSDAFITGASAGEEPHATDTALWTEAEPGMATVPVIEERGFGPEGNEPPSLADQEETLRIPPEQPPSPPEPPYAMIEPPAGAPPPEEGEEEDGKTMTIIEHLEELRHRLTISAIAIVVGAVGGWFLAPRLVKYLQQAAIADGAKFVSLSLLGPFGLQIKLAFIIGLIIGSPIVLYQIWAFVAPGLTRKERRYGLPFSIIGGALFAVGAVTGVLVIPLAIRFLSGFFSVFNLEQLLSIDTYIMFIALIAVIFGVTFELPIFMVGFSLLGVVSSRFFIQKFKIAIFVIYGVAMVITPGADLISPLVLGSFLTVLYWLGVFLIRAIGR